METVNFPCPHCGNLMAVGTNLLGRNVRCPHCKQVVRAPAGAGEGPAVQPPVPTPPPPAPTFNIPGQTAEHHESIFGEAHDEDLFGSEPLRPTLPSVAPAPPTTFEQPAAEAPAPAPPAPAHLEETLAYEPPADSPDHLSPANLETEPPAPLEEVPGPAGTRYRVQRPPVESAGTPAFVWILLAYSVLITIVAGILAYQYFTAGPTGDHPFKAIPDFYGKYEKATGPEIRKQLSYTGMPDPKLDVPPELRVKLGDEITVGDLQVRPTAVVQQAMEMARENVTSDDKTRLAGNGLALLLHVKNISADASFHPDDPAFNRAFQQEQPLPYTALQIGRQFFYGPFAWPLPADIKDAYLVGFRNPAEPLGPGQERDISILTAPTGVRTAGQNAAVSELDAQKDRTGAGARLLWRVQLRRGFVKAQTDDGKDVNVSATCVIGVEFRPDDVKNR